LFTQLAWCWASFVAQVSGQVSDSYSEDALGAHESAQVGVLDPDLVLNHGELEIRPAEVQVLAGPQRVGLTVREFQVFLVLAERADHVVRRPDLYREVWGAEMQRRDRSVDVFVRKVRNKLALASPGWSYIHTHFGVGYRFSATPVEE
jgi:DNA-binding response OmpR family regulator